MKPRSQLRRSQQQERRGQKRRGGTLNSGSGNGWVRKNDHRSDDLLIEYKRTDNDRQITIKKSDLDGVQRNAIFESRTPVLAFEVGGGHYVILQEDDFDEMRLHHQTEKNRERENHLSTGPPAVDGQRGVHRHGPAQ